MPSLVITGRMSTAYDATTDRQTERTTQVLEGNHSNFVNYDQDNWYQLLALAESAYNNSTLSAHILVLQSSPLRVILAAGNR